ncbi:reverse transcriptase domain-containing protein [Methylovulum psychrotolerans]|uniref:Retron-type reverse transcriptase n=1 Tax=Methylovulum psychrotolerans TaxID=1704499 RepID=A0A1Z4BYN6_9GAMM|nr:reverse transcriptase domain-containing protein [Methylovulum psychrotolerans]ASF46395.1 Retron-type reverse transcriptase [Methylovulum psychrotolerans]
MAKGLLELAMSPDILDQSWRRLQSEHTPWSPTVSRDELEHHFVGHFLALRDEVLAGSYRPKPLRQFPMQKPDGKSRIITAQYLADKVIQRAILTVLEPKAEQLFHDSSFAYRPKRNVEQALNKAKEHIRCGRDWLVDADIESFFDTIPHVLLLKRLKPFVADNKAMKLMALWLKQGAHQKSLLGKVRGIPQGSVLSPLLCNLYLHDFDQSLSRANIPFVRFADDFLLFTDSKMNALAAKAYAKNQLGKLDLNLHPVKSRIVQSGPHVIFLGQKLPYATR